MEPAFPSYLFVYLSKVTDYFNALNTEGAVTYVKVGDKPAVVRQEVIDQVSAIIGDETLQVCTEYIEPGRIMMVSEGPLAGYNCEVIRRNGRNKILVRINLLNRTLIADMPAVYLTAGAIAV